MSKRISEKRLLRMVANVDDFCRRYGLVRSSFDVSPKGKIRGLVITSKARRIGFDTGGDVWAVSSRTIGEQELDDSEEQ